jgi:5'-nucleotidase
MICSMRRINVGLWSLALVAAGCGSGDPADAPLRILVTNDDGFQAEGIDALVEALVANPSNEVVVSAPSGNRSGSGDMTGPSMACGNLGVTSDTTTSGYPATVIDGCPADAVTFALANLYTSEEPPHVVLSGINAGQNVSEPIATMVSGTVGAAKTAARSGVPALAASQGDPQEGSEFDFPAGVDAVLGWLSDSREVLAEGGITPTDVTSINIPSCATGSIRGTLVDLPLSPTGFLGPQDCESTLENPADDVEAFRNGFTTQTSVPLN